MPKKKVANSLSSEEVALLGIQFDKNKNSIKELESANKKIREPLEAYLQENGTVPNEESGHRVCIISHADVDVTLKYTHRVSQILQPDAMDVLRANKLDEAIETVEVIREDVIERLYEEGKISDEVLRSLYVPKASDAFSVSVKGKFNEKGI